MTTIKVKSGDTLGAIAKRYNTSVDALAKANGIKNANKLAVGQSLRIPDGFDASPSSKPTTPTAQTVKVKSGDTLGAIAKRYNTTVDALAKANGIKNPNAISVGQTLRIPSGGGTTTPSKPADSYEPKPTTPTPTTQTPTKPGNTGPIDVQKLGVLSAKYESNGNPGTVSTGTGDAGGVSYGSYQFATKTGSAKAFVDSLKKTHPEYAKSFAGLTPGTAAFGKAWKALAAKDPKGFGQAQHDYIAGKFYEPAKAQTEAAVKGLDFDKRSQTLNDVLWSTAVQHGPAGAAKVIQRALAGKDPSKMSDADIAKAIYAERGRKNSSGELVYFSSSSAAVQRGVSNRYQNELKDALKSL
ncbi:LysM domain-containing protein [Myxococcaceae bacterium GXIMD 01537]